MSNGRKGTALHSNEQSGRATSCLVRFWLPAVSVNSFRIVQWRTWMGSTWDGCSVYYKHWFEINRQLRFLEW